MKREISLEEISDGKLYGSGDMVKVGCDDCRGCSACCRGMGSSIVLDPYDVFRLETGLGLSFEGLLAEAVELNLVWHNSAKPEDVRRGGGLHLFKRGGALPDSSL